MSDYKAMYETRSAEFEELNEQFNAYQCIKLCYKRVD